MNFIYVTEQPVQHRPGVIGHGEGAAYLGKTYYYMSCKHIPRDKPVFLKWEGNWCGRVNGDVEYIIVVYIGDKLAVLDTSICGDIRHDFERFRGLSADGAAKLVEGEELERKMEFDATPKCIGCGGRHLLLDDDQDVDLCYTCWLDVDWASKRVDDNI